MILVRATHNNGYGCSCCGWESSSTAQIDEFEMLSFEEIVDQAKRCEPYAEFGDRIACIYERDGKRLYGYDLEVRRSDYTIYILIGNEKYILKTDEGEGKTEEELISLFYKR